MAACSWPPTAPSGVRSIPCASSVARVQTANSIVFLRSEDHGYTWGVLGEIPYRPDRAADPQADRRDGFTEPEFNLMPDGSVLCLIRTHDLLGVGPLYWCRSLDSGQSWSHPHVFDDCGVWPRLR